MAQTDGRNPEPYWIAITVLNFNFKIPEMSINLNYGTCPQKDWAFW